MLRLLKLIAVAVVLKSALCPQTVLAEALIQRVHSDIPDVDFIFTCDPTVTSDYTAETASGVPLTDPYAVERDADKGLVRLMNEGGKRMKQYVIPHQIIRAVIRVKYGMALLDRADLIFTSNRLVLVHTSTTNAGIFTTSDVYSLAGDIRKGFDKRPLSGNQEVMEMLDAGLSFYRPVQVKCRRPASK